MATIEFKTGDIFAEHVDALVNSVNCVGVMGRGIALQFKRAYPSNFDAYREACKRGEVVPGSMFVFETGLLEGPRFIINFPTKRHWRGNSRIEDIESGLRSLVRVVNDLNVRSLAIPPLATGLGGLEWPLVKARILTACAELDDINVVLFNPGIAPTSGLGARSRGTPRMTPTRAVLVALSHRYLRGMLDPFITLLEIHKLLYFMQAAGEPLKLDFVEAPHGPYARNLRHVLVEIEGHFTQGYRDGGDSPLKRIGLVAGATEKANSVLNKNPRTFDRFQRVCDLVDGFESPLGMELLATVHWIEERHSSTSVNELTRMTYAWNDRKRQFSPRQLTFARQVLIEKGWLGESVNLDN